MHMLPRGVLVILTALSPTPYVCPYNILIGALATMQMPLHPTPLQPMSVLCVVVFALHDPIRIDVTCFPVAQDWMSCDLFNCD